MLKGSNFLKFCHKYVPFRCCSSVSQRKKICVVGSGPGGFYTAQYLLRNKNVEVDIYEKLPVPFGLLRYGVAPDHQEVKNSIKELSRVGMHKRIHFYGNVNVGEDIKVQELLNAYHAVVLACGAENEKRLGIPGEDSKNVLSARDFVAWYNGHPKFSNLCFDLDTEIAVVIGHGNVAIDVARILLHDIDTLSKTDIAEYALEAIKKSKVKKVILVGRRGPLQVSFTTKEIREIKNLPNIGCVLHPEDFVGIPELLPKIGRQKKRLLEVLIEAANEEKQKILNKSMEVKFLRKPKTILADNQGRVEKIVFGINKLKELNASMMSEIISTDEEETINCGLVLKSVGYQGFLIDSFVPFDENKHIISNESGKVPNKKGLYCSGWIQSGPKGVVGDSWRSAGQTADLILEDIEKGDLETNLSMGKSDLLELLKKRGVKFLTFENWMEIDKVEVERGKTKGKPREKICDIEEMLRIANVA